MLQEIQTLNIIVFGQTGSGKSSLINMLAGRRVADISPGVVGCTEVAKDYDVKMGNETYTFWDTPGLNEGEHGTVPAQRAFEHLYSLIEKHAINLIIYCIGGSRLTETVRVNYDLFWGIMCEGKVPIVLVVTSLETEINMDQWWKRNEEGIKRMGMAFKGHACVTTTKGIGEIYQKEFQESERRVWALVKEHCSLAPWIPTPGWLNKIPGKRDEYMKEFNARTGKEREVLPMHGRRANKNSKQSLPISDDPSKLSSQTIVHNIIVFGESGSCKSSIINMIVGEPVVKVAGGLLACTLKPESHESYISNTRFRIHDTPGLNEGGQDRVPHWSAVQWLYTLFQSLEGVSLLIYCIRGRIRDNSLENWTLFNKILCGENVPIIVVVTGLEHEEHLDGMAQRIRVALNGYGMFPKKVECITSIRGSAGEHEALYDSSCHRLRNVIKEFCRKQPWAMKTDEWIAHIYETTYTTKLFFFAETQLEFSQAVRRVVDELIEEARLGEDDSERLKTALLLAEKKFLKKGWKILQ